MEVKVSPPPLFFPNPKNLYAPDPDPEMTLERYERTFEQDEELGLNDMKTENYQPVTMSELILFLNVSKALEKRTCRRTC